MYKDAYVQQWKMNRGHKKLRRRRLRRLLVAVVLLGLTLGVITFLRLVQSGALSRLMERGQYQITGVATAAPLGAGMNSAPSWELTLVNNQNQVPDNYQFNQLQLTNGQIVDERIYPSLQAMFDDARAQGVHPVVKSGYRSVEDQERLFNQEVAGYTQQGYSPDEAKEMAKNRVAMPGYSEHQMGLAVDINGDKALSTNEAAFQWLYENSYKYGFILRYPADKTDITGVTYEPWHFRYVGKEAAYAIYSSGLCLEEYLEGF